MPRPKSATDAAANAAPTKPALPKGWQWVRFGDVVQNVNATCSNPKEAGLERYVGLEHLEPRDLRIRSWGNIADGTTFNRVFRSGQVLFGKRRAYQRKAAVAHFDGICSGDIYVFAANEKRLIPELLPFLVQTEGFATHAESTSEGSLSPRTKWKYLAEYEFALPGDPAEQRRIAELLRAADSAYQAFFTLLDDLRMMRESEVHAFFGSVVGSSGKKRLGSYFKERRETGFSDLEILAVTIDGQVVTRASLERTVHDDTGMEKYMRVLPGDFAYNTMRMWQGSCGQVHQEGLISPAYTVITPTKEEIPPRFWELLFRYPPMLMWFQRYSTGVASDRWRLYYRAFAKIPLDMPDTKTVVSFVEHVQAIDLRLAEVDSAINQRKHMYFQLLSNLLTPPSETP